MSFENQTVDDETTSQPEQMKQVESRQVSEIPEVSNTGSESPLSAVGSSYEVSSIDEDNHHQSDQQFKQQLINGNILNDSANQQNENEQFSAEPLMSMINHQQYQIDLDQIHSRSNQQQDRLNNMDVVKFSQQEQTGRNEFDEVKHVDLFGVQIVALTINGRERLCLAQISNTLLKEFSYNEIHNRRVALGITCVQCTPVQLEMLRRAGAMPSSSRRCGMITMREAERLCRSFLVEEQPPELPENFYFTIAHRVNYGCKGRFIPARYISSRAKCIECFYCGEFYSPNKFIFHSHKQPNRSDCNPPDSPNINSWRKHIDLDYGQEHSQEIKYAWEDVKSLFNGGTRRRAPNNNSSSNNNNNNDNNNNNNMNSVNLSVEGPTSIRNGRIGVNLKRSSEDDQLIDVEFDETVTRKKHKLVLNINNNNKTTEAAIGLAGQDKPQTDWSSERSLAKLKDCKTADHHVKQRVRLSTESNQDIKSIKRTAPLAQNHPNNKRFSMDGTISKPQGKVDNCNTFNGSHQTSSDDFNTMNMSPFPLQGPSTVNLTMTDSKFISSTNQMNQLNPLSISDHLITRPGGGHAYSSTLNDSDCKSTKIDVNYSRSSSSSSSSAMAMNMPNNSSTNFIYSQLYSQLMQPQTASSQQMTQRQPITSMDAQLALRHHIWSSILANIQCNAAAAAVVSANQNVARSTSTRNQTQAYSLPVCPSTGQANNHHTNHLVTTPEHQCSELLRNIPSNDSMRLASTTTNVSNYMNMSTISSQSMDHQIKTTTQNGVHPIASSYNNNDDNSNCN